MDPITPAPGSFLAKIQAALPALQAKMEPLVEAARKKDLDDDLAWAAERRAAMSDPLLTVATEPPDPA